MNDKCLITSEVNGLDLNNNGHRSYGIQCMVATGLQAHSGTVGGGWGNWLRESFGAGAFFLPVGKNI